MLKHCAGEVVEATDALTEIVINENINCYENREKYIEMAKQDFSHELADIITCVLIIAEYNKIDIEKALLEVMEKNRKRAERIGDKL